MRERESNFQALLVPRQLCAKASLSPVGSFLHSLVKRMQIRDGFRELGVNGQNANDTRPLFKLLLAAAGAGDGFCAVLRPEANEAAMDVLRQSEAVEYTEVVKTCAQLLVLNILFPLCLHFGT